MTASIFSPAQCLGYVAFILGVAAFLQKSDRRLKVLIAGESLVYAVHFWLLGVLPASANALTTAVRTSLSLKVRAVWLSVLFVAIHLCVGVCFAKTPAGWLTVIGSCVSTVAVFQMRGLPMRLMMLFSTGCWLANNIISHSIGGAALESVIAIANAITILRIFFANGKDGTGMKKVLANTRVWVGPLVMVGMVLLPTSVSAGASVVVSDTVTAPQPPSRTVVVPPMDQRPGVDTTTIPPWWLQRTPLMGLGFGAAGLLATAFGAYYVAVDGNVLKEDKINGKGIWVRDTGGWGWTLIGVGVASLAVGSAMVIWGGEDGSEVSLAVGPASMGLQGKF